MNTRYESHIFLNEEPDQVLPHHYRKPKAPSINEEKNKFIKELKERIGEDKFYEMECEYQEYLRIKKEQ